MQVWSLSSGSSGNSYLVREGSTHVLVDAGLPLRRIEFELLQLNVSPAQISAILVTHEHTDHWCSALALSRRLKVPVVCSTGTWVAGGGPESSRCEYIPLTGGDSLTIGALKLEGFRIPHDAREPLGFSVRSGAATLLLATDIGSATEEMVDRAREADLVILESNHDVDLLVRGPYPDYLKTRILSDRGHLSNDDAARTIARIADGRRPRFWLAHLSRTNNTPCLALATVQDALERTGLRGLQISVALRDRRSLSWDSDESLEQLPLF